MRYYIIFLQEGTVFGTNNHVVASEYKSQEYCMVIDTRMNRSFMFEDSVQDIEEWKS